MAMAPPPPAPDPPGALRLAAVVSMSQIGDPQAVQELLRMSYAEDPTMRTAVVQAQENLRLVGVRYRNGNASPTDIVDSEAALTRSQQRFYSAAYN